MQIKKCWGGEFPAHLVSTAQGGKREPEETSKPALRKGTSGKNWRKKEGASTRRKNYVLSQGMGGWGGGKKTWSSLRDSKNLKKDGEKRATFQTASWGQQTRKGETLKGLVIKKLYGV